ncbi:excinuclease ABC subunit UvrA [Occallatibacter riparius]|uniref:UvrABC system protein A n=1 Tax=Occallatibacter riparius TaxID=1002689 RepID=A0A9J7BMQ0_9BACT|nr:excinuclease ABC subunit UvrA [Occallatibacter riparius]UWZ82469.1 excinuclease ABC subunit UvrA [Occallatibacter riparius]
MSSANEAIIIRGARTHNLKNISCEIPHGKLTVVSGVSGSGKSSLAFDTIYAEGQRRYVESLSAYARQFLERIEKPDVDEIDGLAPAIAIKQKNTTRNPRSTVATATEIYDYLRLLYARCGVVHCIYCDGLVRRDSMDEIAERILALGEGTRIQALFPVKHEITKAEPEKPTRKTKAAAAKAAAKAAVESPMTDALKARLNELRSGGFNRLYQHGRIFEFSTPESLLEIDFTLPVFVLVDRIVVDAENRARIVDAAEIAYREAGEVIFEEVPRDENGERKMHRFSAAYECASCHRPGREPEPRLFSFNNPFGACPRCQGFGNTVDFDLNLVIPDKGLSLNDGAIDPWNRPKYRSWFTDMKKQAGALGIPMDVPWREMTDEAREIVLRGKGSSFDGVYGFFAQMERKKYKLHVRVMLSKYRGYAECPECRGQRLRAEARAVRLNGLNICQGTALTVGKAKEFFSKLTLTPMQAEIAGQILHEVRQRLTFLDAVGLEYLTLDRLASTLSGGEAQRIQLATSLGSQLVGALYVLDEPSIGLHTRDTDRLIRILKDLRDLGNTIVVVEHDPDVLRAADHLLDLGPGAGEFGGKVLADGVLAEIEANPNSLTGRYLSGQITIPVPSRRREPGREKLVLKGAYANNLRGLDVEIPLGMLVAITGVSGSGKSTLVHQVLYRAVARALGQSDGSDPSGVFKSLTGVERLNDVVLVDQTPIGRTPRSNPITYIKGFDLIREIFASQPDAKRMSLTPGHFSFNVPGGRCNTCEGDGTVTVEMQFLADVELPCEDCNGTRYQPRILEVQYKGKNIHEVLQMTVKEALRFFVGQQRLLEKIAVLDEVGLGYLRLGQSATTLSGGEAQRVKLAAHLAAVRSANANAKPSQASRILYILDEPTTGLHFDDVSKLLTAFKKLIDGGGSLIVIEHNLDVIKSADWVIDLGPEGGEGGGHIVAEGTPEQIASNLHSHTGHWLAKVI